MCTTALNGNPGMLPVVWLSPMPVSRDSVDVALAAIGFGISCREVVRRIDALNDRSLS